MPGYAGAALRWAVMNARTAVFVADLVKAITLDVAAHGFYLAKAAELAPLWGRQAFTARARICWIDSFACKHGWVARADANLANFVFESPRPVGDASPGWRLAIGWNSGLLFPCPD